MSLHVIARINHTRHCSEILRIFLPDYYKIFLVLFLDWKYKFLNTNKLVSVNTANILRENMKRRICSSNFVITGSSFYCGRTHVFSALSRSWLSWFNTELISHLSSFRKEFYFYSALASVLASSNHVIFTGVSCQDSGGETIYMSFRTSLFQ